MRLFVLGGTAGGAGYLALYLHCQQNTLIAEQNATLLMQENILSKQTTIMQEQTESIRAQTTVAKAALDRHAMDREEARELRARTTIYNANNDPRLKVRALLELVRLGKNREDPIVLEGAQLNKTTILTDEPISGADFRKASLDNAVFKGVTFEYCWIEPGSGVEFDHYCRFHHCVLIDQTDSKARASINSDNIVNCILTWPTTTDNVIEWAEKANPPTPDHRAAALARFKGALRELLESPSARPED